MREQLNLSATEEDLRRLDAWRTRPGVDVPLAPATAALVLLRRMLDAIDHAKVMRAKKRKAGR